MKNRLKINIGGASIKGMNSYVFSEKSGKYEQVQGFITGKSPVQIAEEYHISEIRARQYAKQNKLPYLGEYGNVFVYVFDVTAEEAFKNRKVKPGPAKTEKPPKVPGKSGRPRKETPVFTGPKNPVGRPRKYPPKPPNNGPKRSRGRPRKNPVEALDIVPKRGRGRPRKPK